MTLAWYGHLKFKELPLWQAILGSWAIAFFEYTLMVPANRMGYTTLSAYQLKILQECITLTVFMTFAALVLGEQPQLKNLISFCLIVLAVVISFR